MSAHKITCMIIEKQSQKSESPHRFTRIEPHKHIGSMGNRACSCGSPTKTVKLVRFNSRAEGIRNNKATKVAELMMDNPDHFVCDFGSLHARQRIEALPAEEELLGRNVYILLPMHKLRSALSESDMNVLEAYIYHSKYKTKSGHHKKLISGNVSKILPVCDEGAEKETLPKLKASNEELQRMKNGGCGYKPSLHTIEECDSLKICKYG
ncbi:hypothetical protein KI387_018414 [Taxus chinensis]|uniref:Uncharacterized protein n=1 Tax=Taxus chinensis TaxID=29808 RepID=A0AA38GMW5_TAXCH|nr:hypothetical protein KI387_018414 [Taxus chinensis]